MIQYLIENLWLVWLLVSLVCLLLELTSGDLFILCFAIGGAAAAIAAACGASLVVQIITGVVVAVLSLFFVRPAALKWLHRNEDNRVSNADALIGRVGRVTERIEAGGYGRVAIDGDDWKAEATDGQTAFEKDERVVVTGIDSIIIKVEKAQNQ